MTAVDTLTERERGVLAAAADGSTIADIAKRLHLSESTVRNYLSAAIGKTNSRNRIEAAIRGARLWLEIEEKEPGGFRDLIWRHVDGRPVQNNFKDKSAIPAQTEMSRRLAKDLKQRGFNFCGPVIVYAFAQAIGMVNDHVTACFRHAECARLGRTKR